MKGLVRHIPNTLTCLNLIFGFYAAMSGLTGNYFCAMTAILLAAVFDFSDGLAARLLKAYSALGKELDSLADVISFGVAPGMMLFSYLDKLSENLSWNDSIACKCLLFTSFAIPVFSAIRLAKFNIDDRQTTSFIGLPVPAHAIFWSSLITVLAADTHASWCILPQIARLLSSINPEIMIFILSASALATSLLLTSRIRLFSLKISTLSWKANRPVYLLLAAALLLILFFGILGITATILLYILLSLIFSIAISPL